jgi:hypothetical protein
MARLAISKVLVAVVVAMLTARLGAVQADVFYEQPLAPHPLPILLPTKFAGHDYLFLLDTGSSRNLCDPALRPYLGPLVARVPASTPSGIIKLSFYAPPPISVGRGRVSETPIGIQDFSGLRLATGFNIRGLLGSAAFTGAAIWLDFSHHSLKLAKNVSPRGMNSLDLLLGPDGVSPYIAVNIEGVRVLFCLDLGFNGTVGLSRQTCAKFAAKGIFKEFRDRDEESFTMAGKMKNRSGIFLKGELLGKRLYDVSISNKGDFNMIGMEFLVNYDVIIDLEKGKFYYQPRHAERAVNVYGMLGAIIFCENGVGVVYQVRPGAGPASDAGLRAGDRVTKLGKLSQGQFNAATLYELGRHSAGRTLEVELLRKGSSTPIHTRLKLER